MFIFDGAMGTMLQAAGLKESQCPELFNIEHPEIIINIHKEYLKAGADIITTNTFGASSLKLEDYNLQDKVKEINTTAVVNARKAIEEVKPSAKIAGDIGPTGRFLQPLGNMSFDSIYHSYLEQANALVEAGVDFLIIETIIDVQEMRAALLAALDARHAHNKTKDDLQIICQFSFSEDGRTITGTPPNAAAVLLEAMGADIIGINCSLGPIQLVPLIEEIASVTNLPISAQPNAGMPTLIDKETIFPLGPSEMGPLMKDLADAGATYIGGCCGTTPQHIAEFSKQLNNYTPKERPIIKPFTAITSRTRLVRLGHDEKPKIIGERINPTGRKVLAAELREGKYIMVKRDALAQVEAGADILDVNMGVAGLDQSPLMEKAIFELSSLVDVPLSIDTLDSKALEIGLKNYPGRALINSVNAEEEQIQAIMPLAKRYGAALLCLPISAGNFPTRAEERLKMAQHIVNQAYSYDLRPNDLLLDPLVLTLASGNDSAKETLKTLQLYKKEFGFPTVMGLSNVSFGMPQRPYLNAQFLTMAMSNGLTTPIMNPLNYSVQKAFKASCTLLGWDPGATQFIKDYGHEQEGTIPNKTTASIPEQPTFKSNDPLSNIQHCVEQGEKEAVIELIQQAIEKNLDPLDITKKGLSEAMTVVGQKFASGKLFLPQVMLAAETMQVAFNTLKATLPQATSMAKGTIILGTVKGDIHDLGKNIVAALLENNGYEVIDLGKDVEPERIIEAIKKYKAKLIGICSLMTTTMPQIDTTINAIRQAGLTTKVMIGGAVVSQNYADSAGADYYAKDGIAAVTIANTLFNKE